MKYNTKFPKRILQCIGFIISALALFWNLETGLITAILWYLFLCYETLYFNSLKDKKTIIDILVYTAMLVMSAVTYILMIEAVTYFRTRTNNSNKENIIWANFLYGIWLLYAKDGIICTLAVSSYFIWYMFINCYKKFENV